MNELRTRVLKAYGFRDLLRDELLTVDAFPLTVRCAKVDGRELSENFGAYRQSLEDLTSQCRRFGVDIQFSPFHHRTLGIQSVPSAVIFNSRAIYLNFIGKADEYAVFTAARTDILEEIPALRNFFLQNPLKLLEFPGQWRRLATVCRFFLRSPRSGLYIRQLELPNVDTKFIETHKRIIIELMQALLSISITFDAFEQRLGLMREEPRLRFRVLDPELTADFGGLGDLEAPVRSLADLKIHCTRVFIIENKITGICLPECKGAVAFFELGSKASLLKKLRWLNGPELFYWGDLDTHGLAILSRLREHFPNIRSLLMDERTLLEHRPLWTSEERPYLGECPYLTSSEAEVFHGLKENRWGRRVRLEQERIGLSKFIGVLEEILSAAETTSYPSRINPQD